MGRACGGRGRRAAKAAEPDPAPGPAGGRGAWPSVTQAPLCLCFSIPFVPDLQALLTRRGLCRAVCQRLCPMSNSNNPTKRRAKSPSASAEGKRSRGWLITIPVLATEPNDPDDPAKGRHATGRIRYERDIAAAFADWPWCGQIEEGAQREDGASHGYLHWQIWMETGNPKKFSTVKNRLAKAGMPDAHIEPRKGTKAQAYAYVTKEETRVNHTIEINIG